MSDQLCIAFVCVENAGRSQMATAFAERERQQRGLEHAVDLVTGGTDPADAIHEIVVDAMAEHGIDLSDRRPRPIAPEDLEHTDLVVTMGCSATDVCPATWSGDNRNWELEDPAGKSMDEVRAIRDEIRHRVHAFFEEIEPEVANRA